LSTILANRLRDRRASNEHLAQAFHHHREMARRHAARAKPRARPQRQRHHRRALPCSPPAIPMPAWSGCKCVGWSPAISPTRRRPCRRSSARSACRTHCAICSAISILPAIDASEAPAAHGEVVAKDDSGPASERRAPEHHGGRQELGDGVVGPVVLPCPRSCRPRGSFPGSARNATRSRTVSLPIPRWRATRSSPPICSASRSRARSSSIWLFQLMLPPVACKP
jgi:hypothetical protein